MNRRIIVIDDEESILDDYRLILSSSRPALKNIVNEIADLETAVFGGSTYSAAGSDDLYELSSARQGEDGFKMVRAARNEGHPFAVAFIDVRMPPGWDGVETAKMIRQTDPEIEIVIVTAFSDRERRQIVTEVGAPERLLYLKKPFDPEEIRQLALALTRKWTLERRAERYRNYLENLLASVRRLKTLSISSVKEVLSAILNEVLFFVGSRKGFIFTRTNEKLVVEMVADGMSAQEVNELLTQVSDMNLTGLDSSQRETIQIFPLRDHADIYVLVTSMQTPISDDYCKLLRLLLETCSDVLSSMKKQAQLIRHERVAAIGQIATGIIHEVKNPLTGIMGAAQLFDRYGKKILNLIGQYDKELAGPDVPSCLRDRVDDLKRLADPDTIRTKMEEKYAVIKNGVQRIDDLMKNIRGFFKGSDAFNPQFQDVSEAIEDTLSLAQSTMKYGINVHREWEIPLMAWTDLNGFRQVILNLIINAAQAMDGMGDIWIVGRSLEDRAVFIIKDSGPGIPPEMVDRVFDAFFTTKTEGTGLGLSIVKEIVEKHHGRIWVETEPGHGSAFYMELPHKFPTV